MKKIIVILFFSLYCNIGFTQSSTSCRNRDSVEVSIIKIKELKTGKVFYYMSGITERGSSLPKDTTYAGNYKYSAPLKFGIDSISWPFIDSLMASENTLILFTSNYNETANKDTFAITNIRTLNVNYDFCFLCDFPDRSMFCDDDHSTIFFTACNPAHGHIEHCSSCYYYINKINSW